MAIEKSLAQPRASRSFFLQAGLLSALALLLLFVLYWGTFSWWWTEWTWGGSFYAHAIFVPFFVLVMVYRNRERLKETPHAPAWGGVVLTILAMALLLFGNRGGVAVVKSISFVLLLLGGMLMLGGLAKTKTLLFPLLFSVMMIPLIPDQLINSIAFPIQITSATIARHILNLILIPTTQQGTLLQLENYRMAVELPCSGFKTLLSLLTFSAAFAYLVEGALWKRWLLFFTTLPLSLLINALRIAMIGIVGELISNAAASKFHDYSGFIVITLAFFFLYTYARILKCDRFLGLPMNSAEEAKDEAKAQAIEEGKEEPEPAALKQVWEMRPSEASVRRAAPALGVLSAIFALTIGAERILPGQPLPEAPIGRAQVPDRFTYDGSTFVSQDFNQKDTLDKAVSEELQPLKVIHRVYEGSRGERIRLLITAGNGRKVFHDPHTCSIGQNAMLQDLQEVAIPTQHGELKVQESQFRYVKNDYGYKAMFCYVMEDEIMQQTTQVRNRLLWQLLRGDMGKPSYFVRVTHELAGEDPARHEDLKRFLGGLWNAIGSILMGKQKGVVETPTADEAARP